MEPNDEPNLPNPDSNKSNEGSEANEAPKRGSERENEGKRTHRKWISPKEYELYRELLRIRDGPFCRNCKKSEREYQLEIDHINGDPNDWSLENIRFLCKSHNQSERRRMEWEHAHEAGAIRLERESVRENVRVESMVKREERVDFAINLPNVSEELKVNRDKEPQFRREVLNEVMRVGWMTVPDALDGISEKISNSQVASRRYLKKMTSKYGPLVVEETNQGTKILRLNPNYWGLNQTKDGIKN